MSEGAEMAKPKTTDTTKIFNLDLPITEANCKKITAMIEREDLSEAQKVGGVALQLLNDLAEGGMMLKSDGFHDELWGRDKGALLNELFECEDKFRTSLLRSKIGRNFYSEFMKYIIEEKKT